MPAGRPTDYTNELADEFCRRIVSGRSTFSVCEDDDMPADTTVYRWRLEKPEFRDKITQAREERLEAYADRIMVIADRVMKESTLDPMRANCAVTAIDRAARLTSDKKRVEITGAGGKPLISAVPISPEEWAKRHGAEIEDETT